ncbi:hypothetical protein [Occultella gossypii]|uniref:Secreted protein n=1 Tax=Occultella gossypii TaxID=2800820 RepID=A0ABS7SEU7_9MICO|nr:hypothetical protein [Occultella gossypii]MBZ2198885.1 hypothetical protein [Occultella gossypii]
MIGGSRRIAAALAALTLLLVVGGCARAQSPDPVQACAEGEVPEPSGEPGDAEILLEVASGFGPEDVHTVVYGDRHVATLTAEDEGALAMLALPRYIATPYDSGPGAWQGGHLPDCALMQIRERAEEIVVGDHEFGEPTISDSGHTYVTYTDADGTQHRVGAYALGSEDGVGGISGAERMARERLLALISVVTENVATTEILPLDELQLDGGVEAVEEDPGGPEWPLEENLAQTLDDRDCVVFTGHDAQDVYRFLLDGGFAEVEGSLTVRALPPGFAGCVE